MADKNKRIELPTEPLGDETPSKDEIQKARELAKECSPLMGELFDAESK